MRPSPAAAVLGCSGSMDGKTWLGRNLVHIYAQIRIFCLSSHVVNGISRISEGAPFAPDQGDPALKVRKIRFQLQRDTRQVADRFHLMLNLRQAVERELALQRRHLRITPPNKPASTAAPITENAKSPGRLIQVRSIVRK